MNIGCLHVRDPRVCVALVARSRVETAVPRTAKAGWWWCSVARRQVLVAYNRQVRLLPEDLQHRECGLIEIGRKHARDFDAGHAPSGGRVQRVLTELRKLTAEQTATTATPVSSELDNLRARRAARLTGAQDRKRPAVDHERGLGDC
jgi:hypothetical protein